MREDIQDVEEGKKYLLENRTRVLTMISGIITILMGIVFGLGVIVITIMLLSSNDIGTTEFWESFFVSLLTGLWVIAVLGFVLVVGLAITVSVFGGKQIAIASQEPYEYNKSRGTLTGCMSLDIIMIIIVTAIGYFFFTNIASFLWIIVGIIDGLLLLCFIFKLIDMQRFKKLVAKGEIVIQKKEKFAGINLSALQPQVVKTEKKISHNELKEELEKLKELESSGVINKEEFEKMRQKLLDKLI